MTEHQAERDEVLPPPRAPIVDPPGAVGAADHDLDATRLINSDSLPTPPTGLPRAGPLRRDELAELPTPPNGTPRVEPATPRVHPNLGGYPGNLPQTPGGRSDAGYDVAGAGQAESRMAGKAPIRDRSGVVALFRVHMFPIGHLPVACDRPTRQLPAPAGGQDSAAGLGFPPHDHPLSRVITTDSVLTTSSPAASRQPAPALTEGVPGPPDELFEDYDRLGAMQEQEWNHRYLIAAGQRPEYVWPSGEQHPEGGATAGEPVLLPPGVLLDRFGTVFGRVFAPDGTPFAQRGLPPADREAGYRRYRVVCDVPMWRAVSAAWFGQPGGAPRYRSVYSAVELVALGYLVDITVEERS